MSEGSKKLKKAFDILAEVIEQRDRQKVMMNKLDELSKDPYRYMGSYYTRRERGYVV